MIRNEGGRVTSEDGEPLPGEYAVGWIKRGPSGVIGTNKKDAQETVAGLCEDASAGRLGDEARADPEELHAWLREQQPDLVTEEAWQAIDRHERSLGKPQRRPRVKLCTTRELLDVARSLSAVGTA